LSSSLGRRESRTKGYNRPEENPDKAQAFVSTS
jgi:hypothetical protein